MRSFARSNGFIENVRNEFEHYIPKSYYVGIPALISTAHLALRITEWLLYDSRTVLTIYIPRGARTRLLESFAAFCTSRYDPLPTFMNLQPLFLGSAREPEKPSIFDPICSDLSHGCCSDPLGASYRGTTTRVLR